MKKESEKKMIMKTKVEDAIEIVKKKYGEDKSEQLFEIIKEVDEIENDLLTEESKERLRKELN